MSDKLSGIKYKEAAQYAHIQRGAWENLKLMLAAL
jgi:hypothetical protein